MDAGLLIKVFGSTIVVVIIGSIVGVNMICHISDSLEKCRSKILFVIERLIFSIFNTLVLSFGLMGFLYYKELPLKIESLYFMLFLSAVLITSAISFEITKLIVDITRKYIDKEAKKRLN